MSVLITGRILNSQVDKRASLGNDQIIRFIEPLGNWNKIRVGIRLSVNALADVTGTPRLYLGMCNGVESHASGAGSMTTRNFVGTVTSAATWSYGSGVDPNAGIPYLQIGETRGVVRVGTTNTTISSATVSTLTATPQLRRTALYATIDKTTPSATTVEMLTSNNIGVGLDDISLSRFIEQLESETTVILDGYQRTVISGSLSVDEATNGVLNAVNVSWSKTPNRIEISDISYHVFS